VTTAAGSARPLSALLAAESIRLDGVAGGRDDAIRLVGAGLVASGAVDGAYVEAMIQRENSVSTFMGEAIAIPHATLAAKGSVQFDALSFVRFPDGVDWDGNDVRLAFGIAAQGRGHIALLSRLASIIVNPDRAKALRDATTVDDVYRLLDADPE
jgi:PTS system mannitol-specific IIA component